MYSRSDSMFRRIAITVLISSTVTLLLVQQSNRFVPISIVTFSPPLFCCDRFLVLCSAAFSYYQNQTIEQQVHGTSKSEQRQHYHHRHHQDNQGQRQKPPRKRKRTKQNEKSAIPGIAEGKNIYTTIDTAHAPITVTTARITTRTQRRVTKIETIAIPILTDTNIHDAVRLYTIDPDLAIEKYKVGRSISNWDTSAVTNMSFLFANLLFDDDISRWNTSSVVDFSHAFENSVSFRCQNIRTETPLRLEWDTSKVRYMNNMFHNASNFNGDISGFNTSNVVKMNRMFKNALSFGVIETTTNAEMNNDNTVFNSNADLSKWDTSSVVLMNELFCNASSFRGNISNWNVSRVRTISGIFSSAHLFDSDLSKWDTKNVRSMSNAFYDAKGFNNGMPKRNEQLQQTNSNRNSKIMPIYLEWNTSNCVNMRRMFMNAESFQGYGLLSWDTSRITTMVSMFQDAKSFDFRSNRDDEQQRFEYWDTSRVTDFSHTFHGASSFTGSIPGTNFFLWDVRKAKKFSYTFADAFNFNNDGLSIWDVSSAIDLSYMFSGCRSFDADLSIWDTSNVISMEGMFQGAKLFNFGCSNSGSGRSTPCRVVVPWNTSKVLSMSKLFYDTVVFNADVSRWDISSTTNLSQLFSGASIFDQDMSHWNTMSVITMESMFQSATNFNNGYNGFNRNSLNRWDTSSVTNMEKMFQWAVSFNSDISNWNTSSVSNMNNMFREARGFSFFGGALSSSLDPTSDNYGALVSAGTADTDTSTTKNDQLCWDISNVNNSLLGTFVGAGKNSPIVGATGTDKVARFDPACVVLTDRNIREIVQVVIFREIRNNHVYNVRMSDWDTSRITNMSALFKNYNQFRGSESGYSENKRDGSNNNDGDYDISSWNTSRVTDFSAMFEGAVRFQGDLSRWDVSSVRHTDRMFYNALLFNADISDWNTCRFLTVTEMFSGAISFTGYWFRATGADTGGDRVEMTPSTQQPKTQYSINGNKSMTNLSSVPLVKFATAKTIDISMWDMSNTQSMARMFKNAISFNADIGKWDTSIVADYSQMFMSAARFNQDLSNWNIFSPSPYRNEPLSVLTASNSTSAEYLRGTNEGDGGVVSLHYMFYNATSFNQSLCWWWPNTNNNGYSNQRDGEDYSSTSTTLISTATISSSNATNNGEVDSSNNNWHHFLLFNIFCGSNGQFDLSCLPSSSLQHTTNATIFHSADPILNNRSDGQYFYGDSDNVYSETAMNITTSMVDTNNRSWCGLGFVKEEEEMEQETSIDTTISVIAIPETESNGSYFDGDLTLFRAEPVVQKQFVDIFMTSNEITDDDSSALLLSASSLYSFVTSLVGLIWMTTCIY